MKKLYNYLKSCILRFDPLSAAAFAAFVALSLIIYCAAVPLDGEKELYSGTVRFHILANSDSDTDQKIKLLVRDDVTALTNKLLENCSSIEEAKASLKANSDIITDCANRCLAENGASYTASIMQGYEIYPRRIYGDYTFPAGRYYSVRLRLGNAEGKNWWCVLFPPLCLGAAVKQETEGETALRDAGFGSNEINLISDEQSTRKEIRFFILDIINGRK